MPAVTRVWTPVSRMAIRQIARRGPTTAAAQRSFSIQSIKQSLSEQVFERTALVKDPAPADWGRQLRHVGDVAKFYFPFYATFIGWVFVAESICDGHL